MEMKSCPKCKQEYPKTVEYFYINNKTSKCHAYCRKCDADRILTWQKNNRERRTKSTKLYRSKNLEKHKKYNSEKNKIWAKNNPEKVRARTHRRRARKNNVISEPYTEQQIFDKYGHNCYLCQEPIDFTVPRTEPKGFQVEHVIAISKGGPDTLENVRPSHAYCNWSKGYKALEDLSKS